MHGGIEAQIHLQARLGQGTCIEFGDRGVDLVEDAHGICVVGALDRDVVGRVAVAHYETVESSRHDLDVGDFAEIDGPVATPAHDQFIEFLRFELAGEANRVLAPADIREPARRVGRTRQCPDDVVHADPECGRAVGVEPDLHLARLLAVQVDLGNAGDPCETRFDVILDQLLVIGEFLVGIFGQYPDEHRCGRRRLLTATGKHLWLDSIGRPRWGLVEVVDDVEFCFLDVGADVEGERDETRAAADESIDVRDPGGVAQYVLLGFDDDRLHLLGRGRPPEIGDGYLRLLYCRQQLDRQFGDRDQAEQGNECDSNGDRRPVPGAQIR